MSNISQYELYFDNLLNNMIEGVGIHQLVFDDNNIPIDYIILKINKGYEQIFGYKREDVEGKLASEIYDEILALDIYSDVVINKNSKNFECYYSENNSHFFVSAAPWNDTGFITIFTDITKQKENEYKLIESYEFNRNILQTIPFGMEIVDQHGNILFINEKMKDDVGDVIGQKCWNIHRDNKKQCVDCPLFSEIEIGKTKTIESIGNGKDYEISHTGIIFNNEKAILEIFQNINESKKAEFRLERAEIIAKTGNWELHLDNQTIIPSDGAKKIYDLYSNDDFSYNNIKKYVLPKYRTILDDALKNLIENNRNYNIEFEIKTKNNIIKTVHSMANYDPAKKIIFGVLQDVTEERKNEIALEKSNAVKTTFLSNISHELRTPLNAIIGFSDIIYSDILSNSGQNKNFERFIKSINSNAKHLDELLNNILDYSKIESDAVDILYEEFSIFDLFEELFNVFEDVNYKQNLDFVKLKFILTEDKKIVSDYLRLKQILYNIISNSIKFTEKGYVKISFTSSNNNIIFKIEDSGIGIPSDKIPLVFDRFWQVDSGSRKRYKGTGLGLSISKSLVEFLNGKIWLESIEGKGTTFFVKIPMTEGKIVKNKKLNFPGKTILIIDDVPSIFSLLGIYLNSLHIDIITVSDEINAIEIYKKQKDKIDLIILDLNLYDVDEINLIKSLREINDKCIIISKSNINSKKLEIIEITDYHIYRPIDKDKLLSIFNKIWQK
jgi:signal transduction histidine kinase/PAS domain-containing protein/CheY-like chemotaxis protein